MPKFISDDEMAALEMDHSDSSGFISDDEMSRMENGPGMLESGLRGAAQGASMGYADEITGGLESLLTDKSYEQARNESRIAYDDARKANPGTYTTGELGGGLATAFIPGANIAKGASLGKAALQSAMLGGAAGTGYSNEGDLGGIAKDAAIGAALGGAVGSAAQEASPYLEKAVRGVSRGAADLADSFAARALGAERGTIKSLGIDKVKQAGRQALDESAFSPFSSTDELIEKNTAIKNRGGRMMGEAYDAIDSAGASTFNPLDAAAKVDEELGAFYRSPINRGEERQLENTIESILMRGDGNIPLREAQGLKEELGKVANWKNNLNITDKEKMARDAYKIVSRQIDDAVKAGGNAIESAGLTETLKQGKNLYSNASTAEKLLQNKQAREQGNSIIGLTDAITGAGALGYGGTTGDWDTAGGIFLAKKGLQKYGAQNAALGLDQISKALRQSPKMAELYSKSPAVFNNMAKKIEERISGGLKAAESESEPYDQNVILEKTKGSPYAQVLQDAAIRGPKAFGATHFVLQGKDPQYRALTLGSKDEEQSN